jgi:hypothetical protein
MRAQCNRTGKKRQSVTGSSSIATALCVASFRVKPIIAMRPFWPAPLLAVEVFFVPVYRVAFDAHFDMQICPLLLSVLRDFSRTKKRATAQQAPQVSFPLV